MNSLTSLKLYQTIKIELQEFYTNYYSQTSQEPTVQSLCEYLGIEEIGVDKNLVLNDKLISITSKILHEGVTREIHAREFEKTERAEREMEARLGSERFQQFKSGKSLEDLNLEPKEFFNLTKDSPADFEFVYRMRERAIKSGEKPTKSDIEVFGLSAPVEEPPVEEPKAPPVEEPEPETPPAEQPAEEPVEEPKETPKVPPTEEPVEKPKETPKTKPSTEPKPETETKPVTEPKTKPQPEPEQTPEPQTTTTPPTPTTPQTKEVVAPKPKQVTTPKSSPQGGSNIPISSGVRTDMPEPNIRKVPAFQVSPQRAIPVKTVTEKGKDEPTKSSASSKETPDKPFTGDMADVRWHALRSALAGIQQVYEGVHKPSKANLGGAKAKGSKYKIVMTGPGGKKTEVRAGSLAGVKRAVYGKTEYQVFNSQGTNISTYFKQPKKHK